MGLELATAATGVVLGYFRRVPAGTPTESDVTAQRVVSVLENMGRGDPATRSALQTLRARPDDPAARALLEQRIGVCAQHYPAFRSDLSRSMRRDRRGNRRWLVLAGSALVVIALVCGGTAVAYLRSTSFFDTKTDLSSAGGWSYRVSEAHLKTSAQLDGRGPAKPGFRYLYLDISVENRLDDREAPGIQFHFARAENTMSAGCGAEQTAFLGPVSSYTPDIVAGWCVSKTGDMFASGASCFETNDSFFRTVDRIPAGGTNKVRCVDSYFVKDDFDLSSLRVYYLGSSVVPGGSDLPYLKQIPTAT